MAVISMATLLFWLTQVPLFTLGAWERTSGLWPSHWGAPFSNLAIAKCILKPGKKVKFMPAQWLRRNLISECGAPDHSCSRSVWVWWFLSAPAPVNLSVTTSRARIPGKSTLSCHRKIYWRRKTLTPGWRTSWEPWRRAFWGNSTCQMFLRSTARSTLLRLWWSFTTNTPRTAQQSLSQMSYEASLSKVCEQGVRWEEEQGSMMCNIDLSSLWEEDTTCW